MVLERAVPPMPLNLKSLTTAHFSFGVYMFDCSVIPVLTDQSGASVPADGEQQWEAGYLVEGGDTAERDGQELGC